ncbi:MAG: hypothetical protein AAFW84_28875 [Cyanobacteria bacterium J06635_15]
MFNPTHILISRSRKVPVMLKSGRECLLIFTQQEWEQQRTPAFNVHPKLGIYCQGISVIGYRLEPIQRSPMEPESSSAAPISA